MQRSARRGNRNDLIGSQVSLSKSVAVTCESLERRMLLSLSPAGAEFRVNTFTTDDQNLPAIACDDSGDFVIAWTGRGNADPRGVFFQRYNAAGVAQGAETRVNVDTLANTPGPPSIAMEADGDFVIVWSDQSVQASDDVRARRYSAAGVPQGLPFVVNAFTTGVQHLPCVAMNDAGDFTVAWDSDGQDGSGEGVYARRFNAAGVPLSGDVRVNSYTTNTQREASIAMDADGDFVVAWSGYGAAGPISQNVYAQRFDASGAPVGAEFLVSAAFAGGWKFSPSVAMDADGDFVIAFTRINTYATIIEIRAKRYDATGAALSADFRVNTFTLGSPDASAVTMRDDGAFVVAWHSNGQDGDASGVYARSYGADGVAQGGEFRANSFTTNGQSTPAVAADADGDLVIVWQSNAQDGSAYGVYAQRYDSLNAPQVTASEFRFETAPQRTRFTFNENVSASLQPANLLIENLTAQVIISPSAISVAFDAATNTATFSYTGNASGIPGVLPDGEYRATLLAAGITNLAGDPMPQNFVFNFSFLNGDADHDDDVDLDDFNILASNFNTSGKTFSQGNFDYDPAGNVNLDDFNILAARFGTALGIFSRGGGGAFATTRIQQDRWLDEVLS